MTSPVSNLAVIITIRSELSDYDLSKKKIMCLQLSVPISDLNLPRSRQELFHLLVRRQSFLGTDNFIVSCLTATER